MVSESLLAITLLVSQLSHAPAQRQQDLLHAASLCVRFWNVYRQTAYRQSVTQ
jgi:hypothetical protein